MKKALLLIACVLTLIFFTGPGWVYIYTPGVTPVDVGSSVSDYLEQTEGKTPGIKPGNQAHIQWANSAHEKTSYALVYMHGFSAGPHEVSPVVENLAESYRMNAFFPRFAGHGLKGDLMENLSADQLFQNAEEAYSIGKTLGQKVILVGTSTGASLSIWLASKYNDIAGLVLLSPNYGISDPKGILASGPLGYWLARLIVGPFYEWKPRHPGQELYWTTRYSVNGVRAMTDVVREVEQVDVGKLRLPVLVLWTPKDTVVDIKKSVSILHGLGSEKKTFIEIDTEEHVLAGEITAVNTTEKVTSAISDFLKTL